MPRQLVGTLLALAAALLATACLGGGDGEDATPSPAPTASPTATASPTTATPTATATSTATPSPTATPPPGAIPPIVIGPSDALTVREFAPGEALDVEFGVFIADATTGVGELWAIREELNPLQLGLFYSSSPDGRFVRVRVRDTEHIVDLATRSGFQWDEGDFRMIGFPDSEGRALFRSGGAECWFWAVEFRPAETALLASFSLGEEPEDCREVAGLFSPDNSSLSLRARAKGHVAALGSRALRRRALRRRVHAGGRARGDDHHPAASPG